MTLCDSWSIKCLSEHWPGQSRNLLHTLGLEYTTSDLMVPIYYLRALLLLDMELHSKTLLACERYKYFLSHY